MKELHDGTKVSSKSFYFLLDWNDKDNKEFISEKFSKQKLSELEILEYMTLWLHATTVEYNTMVEVYENAF